MAQNEERLTQIGEDVFVLATGSGTNVGVIRTGAGIVVVDSGLTRAEGRAALEAIARLCAEPVTYLINTHGHGGHAGGNAAFSCPVVCHRAALARIRETGHLPEGAAWIGFSRDGYIKIGSRVLEILFIGGHSSGSVGVFHRADGVVFLGDALVVDGYPQIGEADLSQWVESLARVRKMEAKVHVPGHGRVADDEDVARLEEYFRNLIETARKLKQAGLSKDAAVKSSRFIRFAQGHGAPRHEENISLVYDRVSKPPQIHRLGRF